MSDYNYKIKKLKKLKKLQVKKYRNRAILDYKENNSVDLYSIKSNSI